MPGWYHLPCPQGAAHGACALESLVIPLPGATQCHLKSNSRRRHTGICWAPLLTSGGPRIHTDCTCSTSVAAIIKSNETNHLAEHFFCSYFDMYWGAPVLYTLAPHFDMF